MSTLTKIFIVVMVVLTIPASVLFIAQANTAPNYRRAWEDQLEKAKVAQAQAQHYRTQFSSLQQTNESLTRQMEEQANELAKSRAAMEVEAGRLRGENARLKNAQEVLNTTIQGLEASVAEQVKMNSLLNDQLAARLQAVQDLNEDNRQLRLSNQELLRELDNAKEYARVYNLELAAAEEKIAELEEKLSRGGVSLSAGPGVAPTPMSTIEGRVTAVSLRENIAQINVGAASGVQKGMRFILYRDMKLVGMLEVAEVGANDSAGILMDLQLDPRQGDMATTDLDVN